MRVTGAPETSPQSTGSGWESLIWPRWLPLQARLPMIAQIAGALALVAAVAMPRWPAAPARSVSPSGPAVVPTSAPAVPAAAAPAAPEPAPVRPAHLNLDVRHSLRSVDLSVTVDGRSVLETKLAGSAKRFGVVGKRAERGFTRTLDVAPGVRIVRVRVRSAEDKFDQTRVERFDLDSASVAAMQIAADKSGLSVVADRPPAPKVPAAVPAPVVSASLVPVPQQIQPPVRPEQTTAAQQAAQAAQSAQEANALAELYQSLRSVLIAMAGFIASAATGFLVQEFLRSRKSLIFTQDGGEAPARLSHAERRRRRRAGKTQESVTSA